MHDGLQHKWCMQCVGITCFISSRYTYLYDVLSIMWSRLGVRECKLTLLSSVKKPFGGYHGDLNEAIQYQPCQSGCQCCFVLLVAPCITGPSHFPLPLSVCVYALFSMSLHCSKNKNIKHNYVFFSKFYWSHIGFVWRICLFYLKLQCWSWK